MRIVVFIEDMPSSHHDVSRYVWSNDPSVISRILVNLDSKFYEWLSNSGTTDRLPRYDNIGVVNHLILEPFMDFLQLFEFEVELIDIHNDGDVGTESKFKNKCDEYVKTHNLKMIGS